MTVEETQREHYNSYAAEHDAARSFAGVLEYRDRFLIPAMFSGLDLRGKRVLEAMCGSGFVTDYLLQQGAEVTGFDISDEQVRLFSAKYPDAVAVRASIFDHPFPKGSFDVVVVAAGFHHLHPRVNEAFAYCLEMLTPGGVLCFYEPHAGSLPDVARKLWYRLDPIFEEGEGAVDVDSALKALGGQCTEVSRTYTGGPAFLLILNGNVFRIPINVMDGISPFVLRLESLHSKVFRRSRRLTPL
ncbi:MAG: class I SAM-dependent methyltransferase, partial [Verrucomicrobiota bacterium]